MKKFVTFSNFMVLLGIMTILFYLIPAVKITVNGLPNLTTNINLFTATFGGPFNMNYPTGHYTLLASGGLIVAFIFAIIAIVLTCLRVKNRLANLLAFPFYLTSGILTACTATMVKNINANTGTIPNQFKYTTLGGATVVTVFFFILAGLALIEFIATVAKPKQPQNPAY